VQTVSHNDSTRRTRLFFTLLRFAIGASREFPVFGVDGISAEDWEWLYRQYGRQALLGVAFYAFQQRSSGKPESLGMPHQLYLKWFYQAEGIRSLNERHYACSSELTQKFAAEGCQTLILKGQANSLLYPDKFIRQTGDIDIWVSGGREAVIALLSRMNLMDGAVVSSHDVGLRKDLFGVEVEVHFDCIQSANNPFANKRLRQYLTGEMVAAHPVPENFNVPSNKFALVMQLSHIYKHLLGLGVGLRQVMDYCVLLRASTDTERADVAARLKSLGLNRIAAALMWVLSEYLGLESQYLLCKPDARRGRILLCEIMRDGNFGKQAERKRGGVFKWWLRNRLRLVKFLPFDFREVSWYLLRYWASFVFLTPQRLLALRQYKKHHK